MATQAQIEGRARDRIPGLKEKYATMYRYALFGEGTYNGEKIPGWIIKAARGFDKMIHKAAEEEAAEYLAELEAAEREKAEAAAAAPAPAPVGRVLDLVPEAVFPEGEQVDTVEYIGEPEPHQEAPISVTGRIVGAVKNAIGLGEKKPEEDKAPASEEMVEPEAEPEAPGEPEDLQEEAESLEE